MKKLLVLLLAFLFVFLCSCESGEEKNNGNEATGEQSVVESESKNVNETENTPESETVAETARPETNADTTVLETDTPDPNKEREVEYKVKQVYYRYEDRLPIESSPVYEVYKTYEEFEKFLQLDYLMEPWTNSVKDSIKKWYGKTEKEIFETHNVIYVCANTFEVIIGLGSEYSLRVESCTVTEDTLKITLLNKCESVDQKDGILVFVPKKDMRDNIEIEHLPHEYSDPFVKADFTTQVGARHHTHQSWGAPQVPHSGGIYESVDELNRWLERNTLGYDYLDPVYTKSIPEIVEKYDAEFFENNHLYIYEYCITPDISWEVTGILKNSGYVIIDIELGKKYSTYCGNIDEDTVRAVCLFVEFSNEEYPKKDENARYRLPRVAVRHTPDMFD